MPSDAPRQTRRRARPGEDRSLPLEMPSPFNPVIGAEDPVSELLRGTPEQRRQPVPPSFESTQPARQEPPRMPKPFVFDEEEEQQPDPAANMNRVTHLPPAPEVGGTAGPESAFTPGAGPAAFTRSVTPPMLAAAASHPGVAQWRVWRELSGGQRSYLGEMAASAPPDDMMRTFLSAMPQPGDVTLFFLRGVDPAGHELNVEIPMRVDGASPVLARLRQAPAGALVGPVPASPQELLNPVLDMIKESREADQRRIEALERRLEEQARALAEERKQLAEQTTQLANNSASGVQAVAERMMEADARRQEAAQQILTQQNKQTLESLAQIFQMGQQQLLANAAAEQAAHQRRLDMDAANRERERLEWERKRQEERDELERRDKERESDRQRQHELRLAEMEKSAQRDREHAERMMTLSKSEGLEGTIKKVAGALTLFGIDGKDLIGKFMGGGEGGSIADAITNGVTALADTVGKVVTAKIEADARVQAAQLGAGMEDPGFVEQAGPQAPPLLAGPVPGNQTPAAAATPAVPAGPAFAIPDSDPALAALAMPVRRNARKTLRGLVASLKAEQNPLLWEPLVTAVWQAEPALYYYCKAVTIKRALLEAGLEPALVDAALASPMLEKIPADVPRS